jgi:uncharacterized membrane protein (UPF0127 family)
MRRRDQIRISIVSVLALCWTIGLTACQQKNSDSSPFGLRIVQLRIGNTTLLAEVADTPQTSANGLMFRDSLPDNRGMLFIFEKPKTASFWMRNTKIPLSVAYLDATGKILEIRSLEPLDETPVPSASSEILFALEVNKDWFARHGISSGARVSGIPNH